MADDAQLVCLTGAPTAWRSLVRRLLVAVAIILFIATLAWLDRTGYSDATARRCHTSTPSTTPPSRRPPPVRRHRPDLSPGARAVTAFVVTPLRVLFLIVLVGTTIELLTERFRTARAVGRWRRVMEDHAIVVGYGVMGASAVDTLLARGGAERDHIVVVERQHEHAARARQLGLATVCRRRDPRRDAARRQHLPGENGRRRLQPRRHGDAGDAHRPRAEPDGDESSRRCARRRTPTCSCSPGRRAWCSRRSPLGASPGCPARPRRPSGCSTTCWPPVTASISSSTSSTRRPPVGPPPGAFPGQAVAVVRGGRHLAFDDPEAGELRRGDVVVCVVGHRPSS